MLYDKKSKIMMFVRKKTAVSLHSLLATYMSFDEVKAKLTQCHNQCILVEVLDFASMVSGGNALYQNSTFITMTISYIGFITSRQTGLHKQS